MGLTVGCQFDRLPSELRHEQYVSIMRGFQVALARYEGAGQVVLVRSKEEGSQRGRCYLYEREGERWLRVAMFPVVVGKRGFRGGRGLHQRSFDRYKQEGDGAAPSGVFEFGTGFGTRPVGGQWPYRELTAQDRFVDDVRSPFYNQWMGHDDPRKDWKSAETMLRPDGLYNQGLVVRHNMNPVTLGAGSAIFFHIWRSPKTPTLGCTAMQEHNMERLLRWLDPQKKPLLVQGLGYL